MEMHPEHRLEPRHRSAMGAATFAPMEESVGRTVMGERRQATVLFADMASYTPTAERLGEEKTFLLMRRVLSVMTDAVCAHEGTVVDLLGDGLLAVFGAPIAQENAPVHACRAASDIIARLVDIEESIDREFGVHPQCRIGIHTGPLVLSDDRKVVGDTVNLAARLQAEAQPDTAVLSDITSGLVSAFFETEYISERLIKGKSVPQRHTVGIRRHVPGMVVVRGDGRLAAGGPSTYARCPL